MQRKRPQEYLALARWLRAALSAASWLSARVIASVFHGFAAAREPCIAFVSASCPSAIAATRPVTRSSSLLRTFSVSVRTPKTGNMASNSPLSILKLPASPLTDAESASNQGPRPDCCAREEILAPNFFDLVD